VGWRRRKFNSAADLLANVAMQERTDACTIDAASIAEQLATSQCGLQVHSDGGYSDGKGAFAITLTIVNLGVEAGERRMFGHGRWYLAEAISAFQTEVLGLDVAIIICNDIHKLVKPR